MSVAGRRGTVTTANLATIRPPRSKVLQRRLQLPSTAPESVLRAEGLLARIVPGGLRGFIRSRGIRLVQVRPLLARTALFPLHRRAITALLFFLLLEE